MLHFLENLSVFKCFPIIFLFWLCFLGMSKVERKYPKSGSKDRNEIPEANIEEKVKTRQKAK